MYIFDLNLIKLHLTKLKGGGGGRRSDGVLLKLSTLSAVCYFCLLLCHSQPFLAEPNRLLKNNLFW